MKATSPPKIDRAKDLQDAQSWIQLFGSANGLL